MESGMIFRYTIMYVVNVETTLTFYEQAFGLTRGMIHEAGDYGELITGETKLAFSSVELMRQLGKAPSAANPDAPVFEIAFETDDVPAALKRAIDAGASVRQEVREEPWGQTTAYVADPNGYLVELCSPVSGPDI
jgi:catechol 2,3-dioxygenase-like lactoylglutathione lyase family enzyme